MQYAFVEFQTKQRDAVCLARGCAQLRLINFHLHFRVVRQVGKSRNLCLQWRWDIHTTSKDAAENEYSIDSFKMENKQKSSS